MTECFDFSTLIVLPYDMEKERQFQISNKDLKFLTQLSNFRELDDYPPFQRSFLSAVCTLFCHVHSEYAVIKVDLISIF